MLDVPEQLGLSNTEQQNLHQQWSTFNQVQQRLKQEGFVPLPYPQYACPGYLDVETLTAHDSRTLTMEYAKYKAWRDFTAERLAYSEQILLETSNEMSAIEARTKKRLQQDSKKKFTKDEIREEARSDQRYEQLKLQEQENKQLKVAYETQRDRFSNGMSLISRAITMRGQDIEQGNRGSNIGATGTQREFGG
jgi:hypothetical protein